MTSLVFMGVAGCGKSSLGRAVADAIRCPMIEGDDFHSDESKSRMRRGIPLDDALRAGWLAELARQLALHPNGVVLSCSALKVKYRDLLRSGSPGLRFVFLEISPAEALRRVEARAVDHLFPGSLVESQFATLESPAGEPGVFVVDATLPLAQLTDQVLGWLSRDAA